jgi:hypothetical protein
VIVHRYEEHGIASDFSAKAPYFPDRLIAASG